MLNKVVLIGNLEKDPELRYLEGDGIAVANFSLEVERIYQERSTGKVEVDVFDVAVWRKQAENCAKYLKMGSRVAVVGRLQTKIVDKAASSSQGKLVYIVADDVRFLPSSSPGHSNTSRLAENLDDIAIDMSDIGDL